MKEKKYLKKKKKKKKKEKKQKNKPSNGFTGVYTTARR